MRSLVRVTDTLAICDDSCVQRRRRFLALVVLVATLGAACSGDDGVFAGQDTGAGSTTTAATPASRPSSTTTVAPSTTRVPGKTGQPPSTMPSTGIPFDPPKPSTTPNVSQPADSLLDGEHVAFLVDVDVDARQVEVDVVQWILRPDFAAAVSDGRLTASDPCMELDYCIANSQDRVRTMPVAGDARVSVVDYDSCCGSVRTDELADVLLRLREGRDLFVLTVAAGQITALDELYVP